MSIRVNKSSLSRDYFLFGTIITLTVVFLSVWFSLLLYMSQKQDARDQLVLEGNRAEHVITESFNYVSHLGRFFGEKIVAAKGTDYQFIWETLRDKLTTDAIAQNLFSWTLFDWINANNKMRVSTSHGILTEWKDMSFRSYIADARKEPWKLHFSDPAFGIPSNEWVIPAGFGVSDKNGQYLGTIGMGFNISKLSHRVESTLTVHGINFVLLNRSGRVMMQSSQNALDLSQHYFVEPLEIIKTSAKSSGFFPEKISHAGIDYIYYRKLQGYPFILLMGYERNVLAKEVTSLLVPRIASFVVIGSISLVLLLVFRQLIIKPIVHLSRAADKVSRGELGVALPRSGTYEIENLAQQLANVIRYIEELQDIRKELTRKTEIAESANRAKSEFLACMSHELRTPLNAIIAFAEILREEMFGPLGNQKYQEYARDIFSSGSHLLNIINDILDLSKAEAGMIKLRKEATDVEKAVGECLDIISERFAKANVAIIVDIQKHLPMVVIDELRVKQIIMNLLTNAVKFTPDSGKVTVKVWLEEKSNAKADLFIVIKDTGIGMEPHDIPRAVEKFGQLDAGLSRKFEGTGLGLPLTKKLVEIHQGHFSIHSIPGQGTEVTISFPNSEIAIVDERHYTALPLIT